ncbi:MAG: hypothetical protein KGZ83_13490 [Sulfuricella sp.]|nr:hypothetical protein [Sulfuricella sp.]
MKKQIIQSRVKRLTLALLLTFGEAQAIDGVVVIGHSNLSRLDAAMVQKIYTGKAVEVGGVAVTVINAKSGTPVRNQFLQAYLNQDEEKYTAYWTVRRYIGKGAPPTELQNAADVIKFVQATPGAVGYIDEAEVKPGINVLLRK